MSWFRRKNEKFPSIFTVLPVRKTGNEGFRKVAGSTASFCFDVYAESIKIAKEYSPRKLQPGDDWKLIVEAFALSIQYTNRIAYEHRGIEFKNDVMEYVEPVARAAVIDFFFLGRRAESQEQATKMLSGAWLDAKERLSPMHQHYTEATREIGLDNLLDVRDGALGKTFLGRIAEIIDPDTAANLFRNISVQMGLMIVLTTAATFNELNESLAAV